MRNTISTKRYGWSLASGTIFIVPFILLAACGKTSTKDGSSVDPSHADEIDPRGGIRPPIIAAIYKGDPARLKRLIANGHDPNAPYNDETPLEFALNFCHGIKPTEQQIASCVLELINAGVDINATKNGSGDALFHACAVGGYETAKILIKAGSSINRIGGANSYTPLIAATENNHPKIVQLLIESGADIEKHDQHRLYNLEHFSFRMNIATPLIHAAANGNADIVTILVKAGANVNARDYWGATALILAAEKGHVNVARLLIDANADVNARRHNASPGFRTALDMAAAKNHEELVKILENAGAVRTQLDPR